MWTIFWIVAFAFVLMLGAAILQDIDEHYQYIALAADPDDDEASFIQSAADADTVIQIDAERIKPELIFNGFGQGRHGVLVWDVKRFTIRLLFNLQGITVNEQNGFLIAIQSDNNREMPVAANRSVESPAGSQWIDGMDWQHNSDQNAAGEVVTFWNRIKQLVQPKENIEGTDFGRLLTSAHYAVGISSSANFASTALQIQLGMDARRVMVPLTEVFFDQQSLDAFLGQIALAAINI